MSNTKQRDERNFLAESHFSSVIGLSMSAFNDHGRFMPADIDRKIGELRVVQLGCSDDLPLAAV